MTLPNFILIGAAKSGTTALYHYLKQHPQVYLSPTKETEFFAFEGEKLDFSGPGDSPRMSITNILDYQAEFQGVSNEIAIGEASPLYIYSSKAPSRIQHYIPEAKLIAILRNPVERAYSQFLMFIRDQRETVLDFNQALQLEALRKQSNWAWGWRYLELGFYTAQLQRYFEIFERNQIKVYLYEDLKNDSLGLIKDTFDFIGVDNSFVPDISTKHNISGMPKNEFLHSFLRKPNLIKETIKPFVATKLRQQIKNHLSQQNLAKPELSQEMRQKLILVFREDILRLQDLIQRDLSIWLQ